MPEVTTQTVNDYLLNMYGNEDFLALEPDVQENIIFSAHEMLRDRYRDEQITDRAVSLQVLYMLEGDAEEFAKLKRHGVKSYSVKGVSVTFDGDMIAPMVVNLLEPSRGARTARLI